ncbi:MAG: PHP-associated domain-containing protein, partial [Halobacteria archaeon]|nr:PHP-associated domain-containing protein [Halobacteria archaeon]
VAGSDAHIASMVGRAYTVVNADPDPESVLEAIVEGETEPVGKRTPLSLSLRQFAASGRRKVTSSVRSYVGALL